MVQLKLLFGRYLTTENGRLISYPHEFP